MNLFVLAKDPIEAAKLQCNAHIVKMTVESAQMLSTAHRMLDGYVEKNTSKSGKRQVDHWIHPDPFLDKVLYKAVHFKHPCTVWTMKSNNNYTWHYVHFVALCEEFTYRYGKPHSTEVKLKEVLKQLPKNIPVGYFTPQPLAMGSNPECMNPNDIVGSYRAFYQTKQERFKMSWKKRPVPEWFQYKENTNGL
jgi:hypothetical protein